MNKRATAVQQVGYSPEEGARVAGVGRNKIYEALNSGKLASRKWGRRRIIMHDDLVAMIANLPT